VTQALLEGRHQVSLQTPRETQVSHREQLLYVNVNTKEPEPTQHTQVIKGVYYCSSCSETPVRPHTHTHTHTHRYGYEELEGV